MATTSGGHLWVGQGQVEKLRGLFVFDPELQSDSRTHVRLFSVDDRILRKFVRDVLAQHVTTCRDAEAVAIALSAYRNWRLTLQGEDALREVASDRDREAQERRAAARRHRDLADRRMAAEDRRTQHLLWREEQIRASIGGVGEARRQEVETHFDRVHDFGEAYRGVNPGNRFSSRQTVCFECKVELSSRDDLECQECHWIVCGSRDCGACGCTRVKRPHTPE